MTISAGIALHPTAVRGVVLENARGRLTLIAADEIPCALTEPEALTGALGQLRQRLRLAHPVILGVPTSSAILTTLNPLVTVAQRAELALRFELQQQLPFELREAVWHYHWLSENGRRPSLGGVPGYLAQRAQQPPALRAERPSRQSSAPAFGVGAPGGERSPSAVAAQGDWKEKGEPSQEGSGVREGSLKGRPPSLSPSGSSMMGSETSAPPPLSRLLCSPALAVATRRSLIEERLACCRRAGLSVSAVSVEALALLNAWGAGYRASGDASRAALFHWRGEREAEWIVRTSERLQVVPVSSASPETFWQELKGVWQALWADDLQPPPLVHMIGPSAEAARVERELSIQTEWLNPDRIISSGSVQWERPERFVSALGLALQGARPVPMPLNLLAQAQEEVREKRIRRAAALANGVCAAAIVGFGLSGMLEMRKRRANLLESLERQERLYQRLRPEVRGLLQRQQRLERRSLQLERLVGEGPLLTQWAAQIIEALPDTVWLTGLDCSKTGIVTGLLEGRAKSFQEVTQFTEQLKSLAGMTTVKPLSTTVMTDPSSNKEVIGFSVQVQRPLRQ